MLSPTEFTVGNLGSAEPFSLVLPRTDYDATALIGKMEDHVGGVFLAGQFPFHCFKSVELTNWAGIIIPDARVEVDQDSIFDPDAHGAPIGSAIRSDTRLLVTAKREHSYGQLTAVTVAEGLAPTGVLRAGFSRWQVVIGNDLNKRVLWQAPAPN